MTNTTPSAARVRRVIGILMLSAVATLSVGVARAEENVPTPGTPNTPGAGANPLRWRGRLHPPVREQGPTVPVPEPATMTLAAMGLVALGTALRNRKR